jgi:hypothetical protein
MSRKIQILTLLATLCTGVAFAKHVYVQTAAGVSVFDTNMKIVGNYTPYGTMAGVTGSHLIMTGDGVVEAYEVAPNGAIGELVADGGLGCGTTAPPLAELDNSGKNVWLVCENYLYKFNTNPEGNILEFESYTSFPYDTQFTLPTFTGAQEIPVGVVFNPGYLGLCEPFFYIAGGLSIEAGPEAASGWYFAPTGPLAHNPTDNVAVAMVPVNAPNGECGTQGPTQLASFIAPPANQHGGSYGLISQGQTYKNMPTVPGGVSLMTINPAGNVLAVATSTGTQFFHFNGAKPITEFTGIVGTSGFIVSYAWNGDTLYAINGASGKLHVYDVSTSKVVEAKGSPYSVSGLEVFVK